MDGLEATQRIRALPGGREVKIVALTASVFQEERDSIITAGMDDFISKPYRADEIFDCLARQLGVEFTYAETLAASTAQPASALRPEALAALPAELRQELSEALVRLDSAQINALISRISGQNSALGEALAIYAGQLSYTTILQALQAAARKEAS
jgi:CheY-like chemotaxis protein